MAEDFGLEATRSAAGLESGSIPDIIGNMIGVLLSMVGVLFFALMLYGGILWMVARGNQEQEKKALNTITGAIIGIIIVVSSYAITNFVFKGVRGENTGGGAEQVNDCTTKHSTWSCQPINHCEDVYGASLSGMRSNCTAENNCETNLCSGGNEQVCCLTGIFEADLKDGYCKIEGLGECLAEWVNCPTNNLYKNVGCTELCTDNNCEMTVGSQEDDE